MKLRVNTDERTQVCIDEAMHVYREFWESEKSNEKSIRKCRQKFRKNVRNAFQIIQKNYKKWECLIMRVKVRVNSDEQSASLNRREHAFLRRN